jgi:hypothetical protein
MLGDEYTYALASGADDLADVCEAMPLVQVSGPCFIVLGSILS